MSFLEWKTLTTEKDKEKEIIDLMADDINVGDLVELYPSHTVGMRKKYGLEPRLGIVLLKISESSWDYNPMYRILPLSKRQCLLVPLNNFVKVIEENLVFKFTSK
jgi:hypothetical protein